MKSHALSFLILDGRLSSVRGMPLGAEVEVTSPLSSHEWPANNYGHCKNLIHIHKALLQMQHYSAIYTCRKQLATTACSLGVASLSQNAQTILHAQVERIMMYHFHFQWCDFKVLSTFYNQLYWWWN